MAAGCSISGEGSREIVGPTGVAHAPQREHFVRRALRLFPILLKHRARCAEDQPEYPWRTRRNRLVQDRDRLVAAPQQVQRQHGQERRLILVRFYGALVVAGRQVRMTGGRPDLRLEALRGFVR